MRHKLTGAGVAILAGLAWLTFRPVFAQDKPPTIKEIMGKLNKGQGALTSTLKAQLQAASPDWATIQKETADYAELAGALARNRPPRGEVASWAKLAKHYGDAAQALNAAAQAKDKDAALTAHRSITGSCNECHKAHRE